MFNRDKPPKISPATRERIEEWKRMARIEKEKRELEEKRREERLACLERIEMKDSDNEGNNFGKTSVERVEDVNPRFSEKIWAEQLRRENS